MKIFKMLLLILLLEIFFTSKIYALPMFDEYGGVNAGTEFGSDAPPAPEIQDNPYYTTNETTGVITPLQYAPKEGGTVQITPVNGNPNPSGGVIDITGAGTNDHYGQIYPGSDGNGAAGKIDSPYQGNLGDTGGGTGGVYFPENGSNDTSESNNESSTTSGNGSAGDPELSTWTASNEIDALNSANLGTGAWNIGADGSPIVTEQGIKDLQALASGKPTSGSTQKPTSAQTQAAQTALGSLKQNSDGTASFSPTTSSPAAATGSTASTTPQTDVGSGEKTTYFGRTLPEFMKKFYDWSVTIAESLAVLILIYAGYLYATSAGNPEQVNLAKEYIIGALVGLTLLLLAYLIYNAIKVNPDSSNPLSTSPIYGPATPPTSSTTDSSSPIYGPPTPPTTSSTPSSTFGAIQ